MFEPVIGRYYDTVTIPSTHHAKEASKFIERTEMRGDVYLITNNKGSVVWFCTSPGVATFITEMIVNRGYPFQYNVTTLEEQTSCQ